MSDTSWRTAAHELETCVYPGAKLKCRGPERDLSGEFIAVVGGAETLSAHLPRTLADVVEKTTGYACVNFSAPHAGPDAYLADTGLMMHIARAKAVILAIPGAHMARNPFFRTHTWRNDRLIAQEDKLRTLYPETDFFSYAYVRHMLGDMLRTSPGRFAVVREALRQGWAEAMEGLVAAIDAPIHGLWLGQRRPDVLCDTLGAGDPPFVTRDMIRRLALEDYVEVVGTPRSHASDPRIAALPGPDMLEEAGRLLGESLLSSLGRPAATEDKRRA